jgi:hypothetical protein
MPRYLFTAYPPDSGKMEMSNAVREQYCELNTERAITPHAFIRVNGKSEGHDYPSQIFDPKTMITGHIRGSTGIVSEFSSWSPSLATVIGYAQGHCDCPKNVCIYVLGTYEILPTVSTVYQTSFMLV